MNAAASANVDELVDILHDEEFSVYFMKAMVEWSRACQLIKVDVMGKNRNGQLKRNIK